jgi:uncharacterized protein YdeI (YjbR/CyaY-like superfamily)
MIEESVNPPVVYVPDRAAWRAWLQLNHQLVESIWLVQHRKANPQPCVTYEEVVLEALCFGWIDSKPRKLDDQRFLLFVSRRKPKSPWSASNKGRVEILMREGLMMPAGLQSVEIARKNGSWSAIDEAEAVVMPADLEAALLRNKKAREFFEVFPPSAKKGIYTWISLAKTSTTRAKRIAETVALAARNIRANQWQPKK